MFWHFTFLTCTLILWFATNKWYKISWFKRLVVSVSPGPISNFLSSIWYQRVVSRRVVQKTRYICVTWTKIQFSFEYLIPTSGGGWFKRLNTYSRKLYQMSTKPDHVPEYAQHPLVGIKTDEATSLGGVETTSSGGTPKTERIHTSYGRCSWDWRWSIVRQRSMLFKLPIFKDANVTRRSTGGCRLVQSCVWRTPN